MAQKKITSLKKIIENQNIAIDSIFQDSKDKNEVINLLQNKIAALNNQIEVLNGKKWQQSFQIAELKKQVAFFHQASKNTIAPISVCKNEEKAHIQQWKSLISLNLVTDFEKDMDLLNNSP